MDYIFIIVAFVIGVVIGVITSYFNRPSGTLRIDHSNPEKDIYRMEFEDDLDSLNKKKRVVLKVDNNADLSQE